METLQDDDKFTFSKLNHIKKGKSTRPQRVTNEHKFTLDNSMRASSILIKDEKPSNDNLFTHLNLGRKT